MKKTIKQQWPVTYDGNILTRDIEYTDGTVEHQRFGGGVLLSVEDRTPERKERKTYDAIIIGQSKGAGKWKLKAWVERFGVEVHTMVDPKDWQPDWDINTPITLYQNHTDEGAVFSPVPPENPEPSLDHGPDGEPLRWDDTEGRAVLKKTHDSWRASQQNLMPLTRAEDKAGVTWSGEPRKDPVLIFKGCVTSARPFKATALDGRVLSGTVNRDAYIPTGCIVDFYDDGRVVTDEPSKHQFKASLDGWAIEDPTAHDDSFTVTGTKQFDGEYRVPTDGTYQCGDLCIENGSGNAIGTVLSNNKDGSVSVGIGPQWKTTTGPWATSPLVRAESLYGSGELINTPELVSQPDVCKYATPVPIKIDGEHVTAILTDKPQTMNDGCRADSQVGAETARLTLALQAKTRARIARVMNWPFCGCTQRNVSVKWIDNKAYWVCEECSK